jgi:hypothetical protein
VIVYCRMHGRSLCVVDKHPVGGFPQLRYRSPRWTAPWAEKSGIGSDNGTWNLRDTTSTTVEAEGCRDCGPRGLPVAALLAAFDGGLAKISL